MFAGQKERKMRRNFSAPASLWNAPWDAMDALDSEISSVFRIQAAKKNINKNGILDFLLGKIQREN